MLYRVQESGIMQYVSTVRRVIGGAAAMAAGWLASAQFALAQAPAPAPAAAADSGADFTLSYALVILGIALGMMIVLQPSHRRDRAKPEQYQEKKILVES
jgi:hypothetical protein